jgi:hypothetical protein
MSLEQTGSETNSVVGHDGNVFLYSKFVIEEMESFVYYKDKYQISVSLDIYKFPLSSGKEKNNNTKMLPLIFVLF